MFCLIYPYKFKKKFKKHLKFKIFQDSLKNIFFFRSISTFLDLCAKYLFFFLTQVVIPFKVKLFEKKK